MKKTWMIIFAVVGLAAVSQAAVVTWGGTTSGNWEDGASWAGGSAPVSGVDSVELWVGSGIYDVNIDSVFTVGSGQSLVATGATSPHPELAIKGSTVLTVATGGTMDLAFVRSRYTNGSQFIIESGASVAIDNFGCAANGTLKFIADENGVSTLNADSANIASGVNTSRYWNLEVDLTNYNQANGDIVLMDYTTLVGTFSDHAATGQTITFTDGWTADIDYDYNGEGKIALTNVNVIPEPATSAMLGGLVAALVLFTRRRVV